MKKLYVLVRGDMGKNYQAVQAGHAVARFCLKYPEEWKNEILVYLKVKDENDLIDWFCKCKELATHRSAFYEPDLADEMTAFAALGIEDHVKALSLM